MLHASLVEALTPGMASTFEVLAKLDDFLAEPPVPIADTWGTSERAQRGYRAAEAEAGGPAPLRKDQRDT